MTDDIETRVKALEQRIYALKLKRDAQDPTGNYHLHFQREIETETRELLLLLHNAPELARLDAAIEMAHLRLSRAAEDADADPWRPTALAAGAVGAPLLLLGLWFPVVLLAVVGAVLLVAAAVFELASARHHRRADETLDVYRDSLADLVAQRVELLDRQPPVPGQVRQVRPVHGVVLDAGTAEITDGSTGGTR